MRRSTGGCNETLTRRRLAVGWSREHRRRETASGRANDLTVAARGTEGYRALVLTARLIWLYSAVFRTRTLASTSSSRMPGKSNAVFRRAEFGYA